jgi:hypothetical protein
MSFTSAMKIELKVVLFLLLVVVVVAVTSYSADHPVLEILVFLQ